MVGGCAILDMFIWLERNARIFKDIWRSMDAI